MMTNLFLDFLQCKKLKGHIYELFKLHTDDIQQKTETGGSGTSMYDSLNKKE